MDAHGCPKCGEESSDFSPPLTKAQFIARAQVIHVLSQYDYSLADYKNNKTDVEIVCKDHGSFWQPPTDHLRGSGCSKCAGNALSSTSEFITKAQLVHGFGKYDYFLVEYKTNKDKVKIICKPHSLTFEQVPYDHLREKGCPTCAIEQITDSKDEFIDKAILIHGVGTYDYSLVIYIGSKEEVEIGCQKHGSFWQIPNTHLMGSGCPICGKAGTSYMERVWLDSLSIPQEHRQYRIKIGSKNFKVDGFDPTTNTVYEYYGDYWHGNPLKFDPNDVNESTGQTFGDLHQATLQREFLLRSHGYTIIIKWQTEPTF